MKRECETTFVNECVFENDRIMAATIASELKKLEMQPRFVGFVMNLLDPTTHFKLTM